MRVDKKVEISTIFTIMLCPLEHGRTTPALRAASAGLGGKALWLHCSGHRTTGKNVENHTLTLPSLPHKDEDKFTFLQTW